MEHEDSGSLSSRLPMDKLINSNRGHKIDKGFNSLPINCKSALQERNGCYNAQMPKRGCVCGYPSKSSWRDSQRPLCYTCITSRKVLQSGYWWQTLFKDVTTCVKYCDKRQRAAMPRAVDMNPLTSIIVSKPSEKWGLDFIGPISPAARGTQARYILVGIDYCTK